MATPTLITGFEYGLATPSGNGGGLCSSVTGAPAIVSTTKRTGDYALQILVSGSAATEYVGYLASGTSVVGSIYFCWTTATSAVCRILRVVTSASSASIQFDPADSTLNAFYSTGGTKSAALVQNQWYRIDFKWTAGTPNTWDVQINGTALPQRTLTESATLQGIFVGFTDAVTGEVYFDDYIQSATGTDYPIGAHAVVGLRPNEDGTHNNASNIMEDSAGNDIDGSSFFAYDKLDENPWTSTADADYVRQTGNGTGNYCEIQFADTTQSSIIGVMALLEYAAASATGNNGGCIIRSNTTETTLWGAAGALADYSESSAFYKSVIVSPAGGAWSQSIVNALRCRFGYSGDANPDPYWLAIMLEVAYVPSSGPTGTLSATLEAAAASATGAVAIAGAANITLEAATSAATGRVAVNGAAAINLAAATVTATGTVTDVTATGTLITTLADATASATGTVAIAGAASNTLANATITATGTVAVTGTAGITLEAATVNATGTVAVYGNASVTLADATVAATGTVANVGEATGTLSVTLEDATVTGTGIVSSPGTATGTANITLADATATAAGTVRVTGSAAISLAGATLSGTGTVPVTGTAAVTLAAATVSGTGVVGNAVAQGALAVTLADAMVTGTGRVAIAGTGSITLADATAGGLGAVYIYGSLAATLAEATLAGTGSVADTPTSPGTRTVLYMPARKEYTIALNIKEAE